MKKIADNKFFVALPISLGILAWITFILYCYRINHASYGSIQIISAGLLLSFAGIIISIITRENKNIYSTLWKAGLITCIPSFVVCFFMVSIFVLFAISLSYGEWID